LFFFNTPKSICISGKHIPSCSIHTVLITDQQATFPDSGGPATRIGAVRSGVDARVDGCGVTKKPIGELQPPDRLALTSKSTCHFPDLKKGLTPLRKQPHNELTPNKQEKNGVLLNLRWQVLIQLNTIPLKAMLRRIVGLGAVVALVIRRYWKS
jgi:hypothetical protein